ncbi:MAG: ABC transporter substrate-binding protein, partial [Thermoleophilia bacterium]|nr:ABC transporter substrate-binding protein [Thermoleophilia bacterium]
WLTGIQGVQFYNSMKANDAMVNGMGGVKAGADTYEVELIAYDNNNDQNTGVAGANKLMFEDKVPFMLADSFIDAFYTDSEKNKVLVSAQQLTPNLLTPDTKYLFSTGFGNAETITTMRWWTEKYPDKKSIMLILPDMALGHRVSDSVAAVCKMYSMTVSQEYYALGNPDMSPLGTKVKQANPDVVCLFEMTPIKAIRESGWTGQFFSVGTNSIETLMGTASAEDIEGFIGTAYPTEFDPPLTQTGKDFKEAYTNLFGKWDNPAPSQTAMYTAVIAAIEQAGSVEVDKVAETMAKGMVWESPVGPLKMVARPDMGNQRTVDSVKTTYMKQVVGGKVTLLDTITLETAERYFEEYLAKTPAGGPPAS